MRSNITKKLFYVTYNKLKYIWTFSLPLLIGLSHHWTANDIDCNVDSFITWSSAEHLSTVASKQVKVQSNHSRKLRSKLCHVLKNNNDK